MSLGPNYKYQDFIKEPSQLGITTKGTMSALGKDINGLFNYKDLLVYGDTKGARHATTTGTVLGNKFFYNTGGQCAAVDASGNSVTDPSGNSITADRYIYINNVAPGLGGGGGGSYKGLIPGILADLNVFTNISIMNAFTGSPKPNCQKVTFQTIDVNNKFSQESQYIALTDLQELNPCNFPNGINPISKARCKNGFENMLTKTSLDYSSVNTPKLPDNIIEQFFFIGVSILGIYILYRMQVKNK